MDLRIFCSFIFISLISSLHLNATHLRGGEIIVSRDDCGSLTVKIVITAYLDSESEVRFGGGILDFGDGSDPITLEEKTRRPTNIGNKVAVSSDTIYHTYASVGRYLITYTEPNRNQGIRNIPNSVQTKFHLETMIVIDPSVGCNNSPVMLIPPIDKACGGVAFYHNPGAYDPDGDSLSYELVVPKSDPKVIISGYVFPDDPSLYAGANPPYEQASEDGGTPVFKIDPVTGLLTWDAPPQKPLTNPEGDEYNLAFIVREWRKLNGKWIPLGFVRRDMQVIVEQCENEKPELEIPDDLCVEAGTFIEEEIFGYDPDKDSVKIEVFSQIFHFEGFPASYEPANNPFQFINNTVQGKVTFRWQTTCDHVQDQPYQVVFKITDNGSPKLVNFETWNIRVIGPSPEILPVDTVDGRTLKVSWDPYMCQNADIMEVWRKVDSNSYEPDSCETGMRESAGYSKIAELPINATSYLDRNLAMGAKYCYRLVAIFEDNIEAESVVSDEECYEFVPADAPIITHVTIENTDHDNGRIRVSWKKPFDLDPNIFTGDYFYDLYRANGFTGNDYQLVSSVKNDTTFLDQQLNTEDRIYNYMIVLRVPDGPVGNAPVDTSGVASSVRLEPTPDFEQVQLNWQANVPWSNVIASGEGAYHYIYRGNEGAKSITDLTFLDSVKVAETGFTYLDNKEPLKNDQVYCYAVMTRGTYGNPNIESPLDNFSQVVCVQPIDTIPPCAPQFVLEGIDCNSYVTDFGCNFTNFQNEILWSPDKEFTCQNDIKLYEVYYASTTTAEFVKIAETRDTFYLHTPNNPVASLSSFKGCYKIRALDRSGNFSEFSNTFCFDNCANYQLPNIFTPNDDGCNDTFHAYRNTGKFDPDSHEIVFPCGEVDISKCARFVRSVDFVVFNRWGKEVFDYQSGGENSIYINWDGRDKNGVPLPAGVYYYVAKVTFDVVDPSKTVRDIKGWVEIVR